MTPSRILVLGSTGFIGRHLVERLAAEGHEVIVPVVRDRNHSASPFPGVIGINIDTLDADGMARLVSMARPDTVFNLAAAGVQRAMTDGAALADGNVGLVTRLLSACRTDTTRLVIHAGSWSEYADPIGAVPLLEDHPLAPHSPYGIAKAQASVAGKDLAAALGIGFVVMRLFNVYGPGEATHRLLPHLVDRLSRGQTAALTPGEQQRDFIYVADVVDALITAARNADITVHSAYNVCTGRATSVAEFCRLVAKALGADPDTLDFGRLSPRFDEPPWVVGDPTRLTDVAGWSASISVEVGVEDAVSTIMSKRQT